MDELARVLLNVGAMTTTIASDVEVGAPSWSIRPEQPIDLDQIHELHRSAFGRPEEAELVDAIRSGADFLPELSLVAVTPEGSVLGHILVSCIAFQAGAESPREAVLALAPLAVHPEYGGRGIGSALMHEALAAADARGEPFIVVVGSPAYYERFGFVPASDHGIDGPYASAGEAFQVRPRPGGAPLSPGTLTYPPAFAGL